MSHWDFGHPQAGRYDDDRRDDDTRDDDEGTAPYPVTDERDPLVDAASRASAPQRLWDGQRRDSARPGRPAPEAADSGWHGQVPGGPDKKSAELTGGGHGRHLGRRGERGGRRRWLLPAGIVAVVAATGAATVLLAGGHPGGQDGQYADGATASPSTPGGTGTVSPSTAPSTADSGAGGPLTMTQAKAVLAAYTTANNDANAERSDTLLAMIETGSSYAIDAGLNQANRAAGAAPFPPFTPVDATYYIPSGEPASGPRWFVVQVDDAFQSSPGQVTSTEYLLFTQSVAGGAWKDAIEPCVLPAASVPLSGVSVPRIAVGADGLATAVDPDAASVAVAPGQVAAVTAASLDGTRAGQAAVTDPGNLADRVDQRTWQAVVPGGAVTDTHSPAAGADGQEFALLTADGGALVFYTDAAEVTITPPAGSPLHLNVPGLYSASQPLTQATVSFLEQFAAYDPPAGTGAPSVVADYSAFTGRG